jgi:hypothetical protein
LLDVPTNCKARCISTKEKNQEKLDEEQTPMWIH